MSGLSRLVPAAVLLAVILALAPTLRPASLLAGSRPVSTAPSGPTRTSTPIVVHLRPIALPVPAQRTYTVAAGDTPWDIARREGVDVAALFAANQLRAGSLLHAGQVLVLPPSSVPPAPDAHPAAARRPATHTVAAGDTLWDIAAGAGVSVAALAEANHLRPGDTLRIGRALVLPAPDSAAKARPRTEPSGGNPSRPAGPMQARRAHLQWPTAGTITSRFGWRIHPIFRTREFHTGLDIATRWGSPVRAARSGVVRFVGWESGYGRIVVLDHGGGLETRYSHLSSSSVTPGQRVTRGELIGRIGSSGWSTGPHLFFEVRKNGVAVDPAPYLR